MYYNTRDFDKAKEELEEAKKAGSANTDNINEMLSNIEEIK
ncbi:hypothetical protein [Ruminiclostridium josui]|nr:hypothetical protein [Ruminiclostridium josui]